MNYVSNRYIYGRARKRILIVANVFISCNNADQYTEIYPSSLPYHGISYSIDSV